MSKAMQIVGIIMLGIFTLVIIYLMNDVRSTNELDYYLLQEVTEASMYDAVDYSFYRDTGQIKVDRDMFLESFNRRFAESVANNRIYDIRIIDFNETPPKASIEVKTRTVATVRGESAVVITRVSGIIETIHDDYIYSRGYHKSLTSDTSKATTKVVPATSPTAPSNTKPTQILASDGNCYATGSCSNNNKSSGVSGSTGYDTNKDEWVLVCGDDNCTKNGPSFSTDLTSVNSINADYSVNLSGSEGISTFITLNLTCGDKTTSVRKELHVDQQNNVTSLNESGTLTLDVSGLNGNQFCSTTITYGGSADNKEHGYNFNSNYSIAKIYPVYK